MEHVLHGGEMCTLQGCPGSQGSSAKRVRSLSSKRLVLLRSVLASCYPDNTHAMDSYKEERFTSAHSSGGVGSCQPVGGFHAHSDDSTLAERAVSVSAHWANRVNTG